jgi:hypothetical protein
MKVSTVLNAIPRYTVSHWLDDLQSLLETAVQSQSLYFVQSLPLPEDIDVVRNIHSNDINTQKIELKAASLSLDRLTWMYGADAEFLGLELKTPSQSETGTVNVYSTEYGADPVLRFVHVKGRKDSPIDAQYVYFIDQFTEKSLNRLGAYAGFSPIGSQNEGEDESIQRYRTLLAQNVLGSLQNYDSGIFDREMLKQKRETIIRNTKEGTPGFITAKNAYRDYTKTITDPEKLLFNTIHKYTVTQGTGQPLMGINENYHIAKAYTACRLLLKSIRSFARTAFQAQLFTHRLASPQAELKPILKLYPGQTHAFTRYIPPAASVQKLPREKALSENIHGQPFIKNGGSRV